ncbi:MAG: tRNA (5-methylaminomethyl-2-thiouridine)(34)-methyltransferase MnmD [Bacteroidota bacterium]
MDNIRIITTDDGSHSLYREDLKETYHSFHGARQESAHVFIEMGLRYFLDNVEDRSVDEPVKILEVGFGTGLNAYLAALFSKDHKVPVHFETLETVPLDATIYQSLNYAKDEDERLFSRLHTCEWNKMETIDPLFTLCKHDIPLQSFDSDTKFDLIFFDAFAPSKQAELWEKEIIQQVYHLTATGGVFTTYCAKGQLKRDLKEVGFSVTTLPGAPGKKEMVRAQKD